MWLINTTTLELHWFIDAQNAPKYAILSHCWGSAEEELTFKDFRKKRNCTGKGHRKIDSFCEFLLTSPDIRKPGLKSSRASMSGKGFEWAWVDTVCIDKRSSAEPSEAINSMYSWYASAAICIVYLQDIEFVPDHGEIELLAEGASVFDPGYESRLQNCRWFTRGWTLQELIAPSRVYFVDSIWRPFGQKKPRRKSKAHYYDSQTLPSLNPEIEAISGIPCEVLEDGVNAMDYSIARRFSWASRRTTSRKEDAACCLLGLFDISMPLIYGEGEHALDRLQRVLLSKHSDESIYAWSFMPRMRLPSLRRMLAPSPASFAYSADVVYQGGGEKPTIVTDGHRFQLTITTASRPTVFRRASNGLEGMLLVRLLCLQLKTEAQALSACVLILARTSCGHYERVNLEDSRLPRASIADPPEDRILDEDNIKDPSQWVAIVEPCAYIIHGTIGADCDKRYLPSDKRPLGVHRRLGEVRLVVEKPQSIQSSLTEVGSVEEEFRSI